MKTSTLSVIAALAACGILSFAACGDDSGTGDPGGNNTNTGAGDPGGGTNNTGAGNVGGNNVGGDGQGGNGQGGRGEGGTAVVCSDLATTAECRSCCADQEPAGIAELQGLVLASCGCADGATCTDECQQDAACTNPGQMPGQACADCVNSVAQADPCTLNALQQCAPDPECGPALQCVASCP
jgi:hypothetical protein